jgi:uncharacterized protein (TIGR00266 family)
MGNGSSTVKASQAFNGIARTDGYEFRIVGDGTPFIEMHLEPGKEIIAETGTFMAKTTGVAMKMALGDGTQNGLAGKLWGAAKRAVAGEDVVLASFRNASEGTQYLSLAAPVPGEILAIDLQEAGGSIIAQKGAFMAAPAGTNIDLHLRKRIATSLFGGEGFVMQRISGNEHVFINAGGNFNVYELGEGETMQIDTGCLLAVSNTVDMNIELVKSISSMLFGNEGIFLATVKGPGTVWAQSMPFDRQVALYAKAMGPHLQKNYNLQPK